ncbi:MAG: MFS transporter [Actinomycetota bacterium]
MSQRRHRTNSPKQSGSLKRIAIDLSPIRQSREYRLLWTGNFISMTGSSIAMIALPYQIFAATHSSFLVGMMGGVELIPLFVCSVFGGSIADATDRRKLMRLILLAQAASSGILAFHATSPHWHLWVLYVMAAAQAGLWGLAIPARRSWSPRLVRTDQLASAAALDSASMTFTHLAGPMVGGFVISAIHLPWTYGIDALSFLAGLIAVQMMKPSPASEHAPAAGFRSVTEGVRFLKGKKVLQGGFLIDLNAMIFGMPKALFPALSAAMNGGKPSGLIMGYLSAAPWIGAFLGSATSGWMRYVRKQGMGVTISVIGWGSAITAFGFSHRLWLSMICLAIAGFADNASAIFRTAIVQEVTPDELRGRLSGMEIAIYAGGPTIGDMESGIVAGLAGVQFSIVSGGLACLAGVGVISALLPAFNRYKRSGEPETTIATNLPTEI